jgi:hypothetical protein
MLKKPLLISWVIILLFCLFVTPVFAKGKRIYLSRHHHYNKNKGKFTKLSVNFSSPSFTIASSKGEFSKPSFSLSPKKGKGEFSKPSFLNALKNKREFSKVSFSLSPVNRVR